jgi:tripartite-type tricarboxylate transporter receptor subunit TctC
MSRALCGLGQTLVPSMNDEADASMELSRRVFLILAAGIAMPTVRGSVAAQAYPTRPVRLIVPSTPGGTADIVTRLIAQVLSERLSQPFVVENRPGGGGNVGTEAVVQAVPDGYTILVVTPPNAVNATLYPSLSYRFLRDIVPIASFVRAPNLMVVNPSSPARTVPEFIAYAKANPGKLNMASAGYGTAGHMAGELFKMLAGVDIIHVPYRGAGPALADLLAGQVQVYFPTLPPAIGFVQEGKLRPLAVTSATRWPALPNVPSLSEFLAGYEASGFSGFGAPRGAPSEIVETINHEVNAVLSEQKVRARISELGGLVTAGSPGDFGRLLADETEKWGRVIKFAGIKPS